MYAGLMIVLWSVGAGQPASDPVAQPVEYYAAPAQRAPGACWHCYHTPYGRYYQGCYDFRSDFDYPWRTTPYWSFNVAAFRSRPAASEEIVAPTPDRGAAAGDVSTAAPARAEPRAPARNTGPDAQRAPAAGPADRAAPARLNMPDAPALEKSRAAAPKKLPRENLPTSH